MEQYEQDLQAEKELGIGNVKHLEAVPVQSIIQRLEWLQEHFPWYHIVDITVLNKGIYIRCVGNGTGIDTLQIDELSEREFKLVELHTGHIIPAIE